MVGGELVREGRRRSGLTQRELAVRAGTTQSAIARLESGRTRPALEDVVRLLRLTGWDLRVELVPDEPSDRWQAADLRDLTPEERVARNDRTVELADEFRAAVAAAHA
jgi:transcriptional regulator with XRE-family HTH domain